MTDLGVLPGGSHSYAMAINDRGDVATDFSAFDALQHVWLNGRSIYDVTDSKAVVSGTSLNLSTG